MKGLTTDHWIVHSHNGGDTWTEDHLGGPFDMHQAPYARGYFVGDYQGLDSQGGVFRPLFTTKRRGAGLGLSFCRQAVEEHGGAMRITTGGKDGGTTVRVLLPICQPLNHND